MGFSRQEYWSGLPFPSPGDLPDPGKNYTKKYLHDPDNHDGAITHLEPESWDAKSSGP